jgi:hypothetical protein
MQKLGSRPAGTVLFDIPPRRSAPSAQPSPKRIKAPLRRLQWLPSERSESRRLCELIADWPTRCRMKIHSHGSSTGVRPPAVTNKG